jgi:Cu/Ag efflux protein CusF
MKKLLVPMVAVLIAVGSSPSLGWSHVTGSITSIDPAAHKIALDNGKTYALQTDVSLSNLAVGDKVTLNSETKGKLQIVNKVTKTG